MEKWVLETVMPLVGEEGQNMLFITKRAITHEMRLHLGVEVNPGEVLRI